MGVVFAQIVDIQNVIKSLYQNFNFEIINKLKKFYIIEFRGYVYEKSFIIFNQKSVFFLIV